MCGIYDYSVKTQRFHNRMRKRLAALAGDSKESFKRSVRHGCGVARSDAQAATARVHTIDPAEKTAHGSKRWQ
jgi:hypothetical protein